jgi:hypothetical protein
MSLLKVAAQFAAEPLAVLRQPPLELREKAALAAVRVAGDTSYLDRYFLEVSQDTPMASPLSSGELYPELSEDSVARLDMAIRKNYDVFVEAYNNPENLTEDQIPLAYEATGIINSFVTLGRSLSPLAQEEGDFPLEYADAVQAYASDPSDETLALALAVKLPEPVESPLLRKLIPDGVSGATIDAFSFDEEDPRTPALKAAMIEATALLPANLFTEVDRPFRPRLREGVRFSYDDRLREASIPSPELHHCLHALIHWVTQSHVALRVMQYAYLSIMTDLPTNQHLNTVNPFYGTHELSLDGTYSGRLPKDRPVTDDQYEVLADTLVRWALRLTVPLDQECFTAGLIVALSESLKNE